MSVHAVTGSSGQPGRLAVQELLARGVPATRVVAVVRTPSRVADLADRGVQVREADYVQPQTLDAALDGVDRLLLISSGEAGQRVAQHTNVIQAAKTAGTARFAYTSILNADDTTNPLAGEDQDTEQTLGAAGVPFTLLRNGWYTENYTNQLDQYLQDGEILGRIVLARGGGDPPAVAAAAALLLDHDENRTYELGGPGRPTTSCLRLSPHHSYGSTPWRAPCRNPRLKSQSIALRTAICRWRKDRVDHGARDRPALLLETAVESRKRAERTAGE
jgi:NAD(P)H dehydrogenase (quinone)